MEHTGMVHALQNIHRLLKPGGSLIDIHPFADEPLIEIHQGEKIAFTERLPAYSVEDIQQAENALARVIQHCWFTVERAREFDFRIYASSVAELRDFLTEMDAYDNRPLDEMTMTQYAELATRVEGVIQVGGEGTEVAYYQKVRIARLTPL
jgi:hypothetical protein